MPTTKQDGTIKAEDHFPSLAAMRAAHFELLKSTRTGQPDPDMRQRILAFLAEGKATGKLLDTSNDRSNAQNVLDYWTATLYTLPREGGAKGMEAFSAEAAPDTLLEEFDPNLAPELEDRLCPYQGLSAFQEADHAKFFGREQTVQNLLERLREQRLLVIVGPSGSGKSSLVLAGLLPALKRGDQVPGSKDWRYYEPLIPGTDPLTNLALLVRPPTADAATWVAAQVPQFRDHPTHLRDLLEADGTQPVCVLVDQFEEVFTLCLDERARRSFIDNLVSLACSTVAAPRVIVTVRSDFAEQATQLSSLKEFATAQHVQVIPPPLSSRELRHAIERPAEMVGLKFEEGIIDDLVKEVAGEPVALPLLQFTLLKLWEQRNRNHITWEAYCRVGSPRTALARTADKFYEEMIPQNQILTRHILLRLVQPTVGIEYTRYRIRRESLEMLAAADQVNHVIDRLVKEGLLRLTPGLTPADDRVEVAHEALIRNWPKLVGWLGAERESLQQRLRLRAAAELWNNSGQDRGGLLGGNLLSEALRYKDLDPLEKEFVQASQAAAEEAIREKETARQLEMQRLRELAEERKWWVVVLAGILLLTVGVAFWANEERVRALQARNEADQARLRRLQERNEAVKLLHSLVFTIQKKLETIGPLDLMERIQKPVNEYFTRLEVDKDNEMLILILESYINEGHLLYAQGNLNGALRAYQDGLDRNKKLLEQEPRNIYWQRYSTWLHDRLGNVLQRQGKLADALQAYQHSLAIRDKLVAEPPSDTNDLGGVALSYQYFGDILMDQGQLADAVQTYQHSLAIREKLVAQAPSTWQPALAESHDKVGDVLMDQGQLADAVQAYQHSLAIREELVAQDLRNAGWQRDLSVSYDNIGDVLVRQGQLTDAVQTYQRSLAIREELVAQDLRNAGWQRDLSVSYDNIGDVLVHQGQLADAMQTYQRSLAIREELVAQDLSNTGWQPALAESHDKVGDVLVHQGQLADAVQAYQRSLAIRDKLVRQDSSNVGWQIDLIVSLWKISSNLDVASEPGRQEAKEKLGHALHILRNLQEQGRLIPRNQDWISRLEKRLEGLKNAQDQP